MKKLLIDIGDLVYAFQDASGTAYNYLDTETGRVISIMDWTYSQLEDLYQEAYEANPESPPDLATWLQDSDMHDWEKETLLEAAQVEEGLGGRYLRVPTAESRESYRDMERFIETVQSERLQNRLWRAIEGRGAFRRFRDMLSEHDTERQRWFDFRDRRLAERVTDWLEVKGIEPIPVEPPQEAFDPGPPIRSRLLSEVLTFVQAASKLAGVTRIALIGSLTTDEPDPNDVDMLVTVTDETDLAPLATLGRKLSGHCQS